MAVTTEYLSGGRIQGRSDDALLTAISQNSWKELARTTLTQVGNTLDSGTFTAKDNLMVLIFGIKASTGQIERLRSNADDGSNYARRYSEDGGSDDTEESQDHIELGIDSEDDEFAVLRIRNIANKEKLVIGHTVSRSPTGGGNAPKRLEVAGKWANTSNQITRIQVLDKADEMSNNNFASGSEIVVLGCDDDEANSGTNFWQELGNAELTSNGTLSSGTFTAKKYLWVQILVKNTSDDSLAMQFNDTGGTVYANRRNYNGATDSTRASKPNAHLQSHTNNQDWWLFSNYIINKSDTEKLVITHGASDSGNTGGGYAGNRVEYVSKWADTSNQITKIDIEDDAGNFNSVASGSLIRVWGSD